MRRWSRWLGGALVLSLGGSFLYPQPLEAKKEPIPVIDLHVDLPYRSHYKRKGFATGSGEFATALLERGGLNGVVLPLYVPEDASPWGRSRLQFERSYAHVFRSILKTPPYALPGCGVRRAGRETRSVETWLAFEGSAPLRADRKEIQKWVLRGVRVFGLVHSVPNSLAATSGRGGQAPKDTGLSAEGKRFVKLVYELGGIVDVSHASDRATNEAIQIAESLGKAIMATHSNARALAPHVRNLTDEQIQGIARTGGVIGVNFHQPFLRSRVGRGASLRDVVKQILHLRKVGGLSVVAIGSDFEGGISPVPELSDAGKFQNLASALRTAGLSEEELRDVLSRNARRVLCSR